MISREEVFGSAKKRLLSGQASLRKLSSEFGIDRDTLKSFILEICSEDEKRQIEQILKGNKANSSIELEGSMKEAVIRILKGEISARQASEKYGFDRETLRRKAQELVNSSPEYLPLYVDYKSKRGDFSSINFRRLFIYMIEQNMSQTQIATIYNIPPRTLSRELEKIGKSEDENDKLLYHIAKLYAQDKMEHRAPSDHYELFTQRLQTLKDNPKFTGIDCPSKAEERFKELQEFVAKVSQLSLQGLNTEQIAEKLNVSISTIRRRKLALEEQLKLREIKRDSNPEELEL